MTIRKITINGLLIALTVAVSMVISIPIPATNGLITPIEIGIYLSALIFGPFAGLLVGAVSGFLIDILLGFGQWAFFSLIIHGLQGFVVGYLAFKFNQKNKLAWLVLGSLIMVTGYFLVSYFSFGISIALPDLFSNLIQSILGITIAYFIYPKLNQVIN